MLETVSEITFIVSEKRVIKIGNLISSDAVNSGVTQPSVYLLRSGPSLAFSLFVGDPLPVGPPSLDAAATPSLRHWL